jgi:hypothetical protein
MTGPIPQDFGLRVPAMLPSASAQAQRVRMSNGLVALQLGENIYAYTGDATQNWYRKLSLEALERSPHAYFQAASPDAPHVYQRV